MLTNKNEVSLRRLKGKKRIEHLFRVGAVLHSKHLLLRYLYFDQGDSFQLGVSVAKRSFNRVAPTAIVLNVKCGGPVGK